MSLFNADSQPTLQVNIMNSNLIRSWNGRTIRQREDGYLSATDMCQVCDKLFAGYARLKSTEEYLEALHRRHYADSHNGLFVESNVGGLPETTGTWVHRLVALHLAQWLNADFALQVNEWVEELLLTGKVELQATRQLSSIERANNVNSLAASLQFFDYEIQNPRFKQEVHGLVGDMLGFSSHLNQQSLLSSEVQETWLGVAERAEQLGYSINLVTRYRSQLGKYVKANGLECKQEKRLCNGTQREINLYLLSGSLDTAIKEYMDAKVLAS